MNIKNNKSKSQQVFSEVINNISEIFYKNKHINCFKHCYKKQTLRICYTVSDKEINTKRKELIAHHHGHDLTSAESCHAYSERVLFYDNIFTEKIPRNINTKHKYRSGGFVTKYTNGIDITSYEEKHNVDMFFSGIQCLPLVLVLNDQYLAETLGKNYFQIKNDDVSTLDDLMYGRAINLHTKKDEEVKTLRHFVEKAKKLGKEIYLFIDNKATKAEKYFLVNVCISAGAKIATLPTVVVKQKRTIAEIEKENGCKVAINNVFKILKKIIAIGRSSVISTIIENLTSKAIRFVSSSFVDTYKMNSPPT